jgi:tRNA-specific 2-thiouridylase
MKRIRVVVAMSGGVDSSVAAALLVERGYDVTGITIKTHEYETVGGNRSNEASCCSIKGIDDARAIAGQLGIPHYVVDLSTKFEREVIFDFQNQYLSGRTPNPCVVCNRKVKWEELLKKAISLSSELIATGHYANVRFDNASGRYFLSKAFDRSKDQSYALWQLSQEHLSRTIFPIGQLTKFQVREQARRMGLTVALKEESFEICFVHDNDYERFLKERVQDLSERVADGNIVMNGRIVGKHRGYPFYTIGQRKGVGISFGFPVYVTRIIPETNTVEVDREERLMQKCLIGKSLNLIKIPDSESAVRVTAKIRYKDEGVPASLEILNEDSVKVLFDGPRRAITPGQSVVFYDGDDVVGGATIDQVLEESPDFIPDV